MGTRNEKGVYDGTGIAALLFYVLGSIAFLVYIVTTVSIGG